MFPNLDLSAAQVKLVATMFFFKKNSLILIVDFYIVDKPIMIFKQHRDHS